MNKIYQALVRQFSLGDADPHYNPSANTHNWIESADWGSLLRARNANRKACRHLIEQAEKASRELTKDETAAYDSLKRRADELQDEIDDREASGDRCPSLRPAVASRGAFAPGNPEGSRSRNADRQRVEDHILRPGESLVDRMQAGEFGGPGQNVPLGDLILASATGDYSSIPAEMRADGMQLGTGSRGGFAAPHLLAAQVIDLARNQARTGEAGISIIPMVAGAGITFPTVEGDPQPHWRGEHEPIPESEVTLGARNFHPYTVAALVRMSIELAESGLGVGELVERTMAEALALEWDRVVLFGTGMGQPRGLYNTVDTEGPYSVERVNVDGPLTSYTPLSRAVERVADRNRTAGDFIMSSRTAGQIDRLVDADQNPLRPPRSVAERELLVSNQVRNDLEVQVDEQPANVGSAIFTGNWEDYYLVVHTSMILEASRVAADAFKKMQILVRAYMRIDGFAVRPRHFCVIDNIHPTEPF